MHDLVQKVKASLARQVSSGDKILVAVSGGADSVCLLHILYELREACAIELAIAHLNHMARGRDSEADADFVSRLGNELGLETLVDRVDVQEKQKDCKTSFQETARILRYRFLEFALKKLAADKIALGHTADDQVETVLINLLRGSGPKGLAGMPEARDNLIRPLLGCYRCEVEDYLRSRGRAYRTDLSNAKKDYLRNRIRQDLVPVLEGFNPAFKSTLLETAGIIRGEEEFLSQWVIQCMEEMAEPLESGAGLGLDTEKFIRQPAAMQRRLVRRAIECVKGELRRISAANVQEVLDLFLRPRPGKEVHLPDGLIAVCRSTRVEFIKTPLQGSNILTNGGEGSGEITPLNIPGRTLLKEIGIAFNTQLVSPAGLCFSDKLERAYVDYEKAEKPVRVRFFKPGDRFIPLGMTGRKKLKSFFIDEKVPRELRSSIPILTSGTDDIIWIFGKRISETYRVTERTKTVLVIEGVAM